MSSLPLLEKNVPDISQGSVMTRVRYGDII